MTDGAGCIIKIQIVSSFLQQKKEEEAKENHLSVRISATGSLGEVMKESISVIKIATIDHLLKNAIITKEELE